MTNGASLTGFTLTNGATLTCCSGYNQQSGGGLWCEAESGAVSNCVVIGNAASVYGGGVFNGTLTGCLLVGNVASYGGGANNSTLHDCLLTNNSATQGGGAFSSTLHRCLVKANNAQYSGGGAESCTLNNCVLTGNSAQFGGGAYLSTLNNCTVSSNSASNLSGGAGAATMNNSIIYYNTAPGSANYSGLLHFCCTTPAPAGQADVGNFTNAPGFAGMNELRLGSNSACINAGRNSLVQSTTDFDGHPRVIGGTVDVGAYEFQSPGSVLPYYWLLSFGLPLNGSLDYTDTDNDRLNNWQEWIAGTSPTNALSALRMLSATGSASAVWVSWLSVSNRSYALERATNLGPVPSFWLLQSNISGSTGSTSWPDTNPAGHVPCFYRVRVEN